MFDYRTRGTISNSIGRFATAATGYTKRGRGRDMLVFILFINFSPVKTVDVTDNGNNRKRINYYAASAIHLYLLLLLYFTLNGPRAFCARFARFWAAVAYIVRFLFVGHRYAPDERPERVHRVRVPRLRAADELQPVRAQWYFRSRRARLKSVNRYRLFQSSAADRCPRATPWTISRTTRDRTIPPGWSTSTRARKSRKTKH